MTDPVVDAVLPPAIVAVLALVLVLAGRRRVAAGAVVALLLFAAEGVPHLLLGQLRLPLTEPTSPAPAAIVVLGGGLPDLLDTGPATPGAETLTRLRTAAALARRTGRPVLVSGGRQTDGPVPIAAQMASSLDADFGVPAAWTETGSTNLWQSAAASTAILRGAGVTDIYLVAQPWELRLSVAVFRAAGLAVTPAAIPHAEQRSLELSALLPVTLAWLDSVVALREWSGLACQALARCAAWMARPTPGPS